MAASMNIAVFWFVSPCSLAEDYRRFTDVCCFHHQGDEQTFSLMITVKSRSTIRLTDEHLEG
jgi:hypothetical protein